MSSIEANKTAMARKMVPGATNFCRILSQWPGKGPDKQSKPGTKQLIEEIVRRDPSVKPRYWTAQAMVDKLFQLPLPAQDVDGSEDT
jgi:hypothetical protein